jgi:hypothetical protein
MHSAEGFRPRDCEPGDAIAIGDGGAQAKSAVELQRSILLFGPDGHQAESFAGALEGCLSDTTLDSIGGFPPVMELNQQGLQAIVRSHRIPFDGPIVGLTYDHGTWLQTNRETARRIALVAPWQALGLQQRDRERFEDLKDAWSKLRRTRGSAVHWSLQSYGRVEVRELLGSHGKATP